MLGQVKTTWAIVGVLISAGSAFVTTTLYINNLIGQIKNQQETIGSFKAALNGQSHIRIVKILINNGQNNGCGNNSIIVGINLSTSFEGNLYCATVDFK